MLPSRSPATADPTIEGVRKHLADVYGISGVITPLAGFQDHNYRVSSDDGEFVFKVVPAETERHYLDFQVQILAHLGGEIQATDSRIALPELVPTKSGTFVEPLAGTATADTAERPARLVRFVSGEMMSIVEAARPPLLQSLGLCLAAVDEALAEFTHPGAERHEPWDLANAADYLQDTSLIDDRAIREIAERRLREFSSLYSELGPLPRSVIHNDANDNNVVVRRRADDEYVVGGLIDFGDAVFTETVFELAIACAYAIPLHDDPLQAACEVVRGYTRRRRLSEEEIRLLFPSICARLAVSSVVAGKSLRERPDNEYLQVSAVPVRKLLQTFERVDASWAEIRLRSAAGYEPCPHNADVRVAISGCRDSAHPILGAAPEYVHDLSVGGGAVMPEELTTAAWTRRLKQERLTKERDVGGDKVAPGSKRNPIGLGRYGEYRLAYSSDQFASGDLRRTLHIGADLFADAGTAVCAPIDGVVVSLADNAATLDYGPTVILRHEEAGAAFYTLYGHLARDVFAVLEPGQQVAAGETFAALGTEAENGGWPPHLHFQVMTRLFEDGRGHKEGDFPGVALSTEASEWLSVCPNPAPLLGLRDDAVAAPLPDQSRVLAERKRLVNPSLSLSYGEPLHIVRGRGSYLYSAEGRAYLDCVNNVCHVGHAHPRVVAAAARQMALLNTNTRYLHENLVEYAAALSDTLPKPLSVVYLVCSGSEANDLALRLARAATGRRGVAVIDHAYHGNISSLVDMSPYKFNGSGGGGQQDHVAVVPMPDTYRGVHGDDVSAYVADAAVEIARLAGSEHGLAAFFAESFLGCGGQVDLPPKYLASVFEAARTAGGVCVADEVQVGFGRVGTHMWAFETHEVVPDIVTMGKPIGNGHPIGAVVTTREIADAFANGMEYFNTFGGNPVSCAVGLEVLAVIEDEGLRERAADTGDYLKRGLAELQDEYPLIGDVRGRGLFIGVELVHDRESKEPAARQATTLVNRMKERGVLLSTDGPDHNVIKIKPPLSFGRSDADKVLRDMRSVLSDPVLQSGSGGTGR